MPLLPHDTGLENQEIKLPSLEKSRTNGFAVANIFRRRACHGFCINVPSRLLFGKSSSCWWCCCLRLRELEAVGSIWRKQSVGVGLCLLTTTLWMAVLLGPSCHELKPGAKTAPLSCFSCIQSAMAEAGSLGHDSPCFFLSIGCDPPCLFFVNHLFLTQNVTV